MDPNPYNKLDDLFTHAVDKKNNRRKAVKEDKKNSDDLFFSSEDEEDQLKEIEDLNKNTKLFRQKLTKNDVLQDGKFTYANMTVGTVVGGCVVRVTTECIVVSLPFKLMGYVPLTQISTQYAQLLRRVANDALEEGETFNTLPELYSAGQYLSVCVAGPPSKEVDRQTPGLALSMIPKEVNAAISSEQLRVGCVLQCSVTSVEDHGYILDTGVKGVKAAFLPLDDVPHDVVVAIGSVLQCCVVKTEGVSSRVSLTFTAVKKEVSAAANKVTGLTLPGSTVAGIISKSTPNGLVIFIGTEEEYEESMDAKGLNITNQVAHVTKNHFRGPFDQSHFFKQNAKVQGRVLFKTDFPKITYVTLNKNVMNYDLPSDYDHKMGIKVPSDVKDSSVLTLTNRGVYVRLTTKCLGYGNFVKLHREVKKPREVQKAFKKKHPVGSKVDVKVSNFNYMDQVFTVSILEESKEEKKEEVILSVGDTTTVKIAEYTETGARVTAENKVRGFVPRCHLTDNILTNPETKHPVGSTATARVLRISTKEKDGNVRTNYYFTFKTLLLQASEEEFLCDYSNERVGNTVLGMIRFINKESIALMFPNNVTGLLPRSKLPAVYNTTDTLKVDTLLKVTITAFEETPKPKYICHVTQRKRKLSSVEEIASKRQQVLEDNRASSSWLSSLKDTLSPVNKEKVKGSGMAKKPIGKKIKMKSLKI